MNDIQITSDIHLEFYSDDVKFDKILVPSSNNLALLGDIGYPTKDNYKEFIKFISIIL